MAYPTIKRHLFHRPQVICDEVVEDSDKENERPPETPAAKPGRKQEAFKVRPGLAAFARRELADLTPLETPNSEPERVVQSLKFLAAALPWGSPGKEIRDAS